RSSRPCRDRPYARSADAVGTKVSQRPSDAFPAGQRQRRLGRLHEGDRRQPRAAAVSRRSCQMKRAKKRAPPKPRNPVARSPLLAKGGVHGKSNAEEPLNKPHMSRVSAMAPDARPQLPTEGEANSLPYSQAAQQRR